MNKTQLNKATKLLLKAAKQHFRHAKQNKAIEICNEIYDTTRIINAESTVCFDYKTFKSALTHHLSNNIPNTADKYNLTLFWLDYTNKPANFIIAVSTLRLK